VADGGDEKKKECRPTILNLTSVSGKGEGKPLPGSLRKRGGAGDPHSKEREKRKKS